MKIFDGVEFKPALTPTMQGVISWALLLANTVIEAGQCHDERLAREAGTGRPLTLDQVMSQSGLRIPGLAAAVEQLMGGTEEAKQVASLIADNPDPAVLVQKFAEHFGLKIVAEPAAPATRPPPPTSPPSATPSAAASPAASPVPPGARMAESVAGPASGLPAFRPDFTREAREATKAAKAAVVHEQPPPSTTPSTSTHAGEPHARPSLVGMVEKQIGALRRRMKAHQAELDERLKRAEAELAELRQELDELRAAKREPAPQIDPSMPAQDPADRPHVPSSTEDAPVAGEPPAVVAAEVASEFAAELDMGVALPAATEAEVIRAGEILSEFAEEVEDHHQQNLARVVAVEREVSVARALVQREHDAEGAAAHG